MTQESTEPDTSILRSHDFNKISNVTTVRGIARHVGTTSVAANLALLLAERGARVLLLDLSLWNCDLTLSFGYTPEPAILDLADSFYRSGNLSLDLISSRTRTCKQNVEMLSGFERWLGSPALRAENGWNFIQTLLISAKERWDTVVADMGTHSSSTNTRENIFLTQCAVHAALLQTAQSIVEVCDSIEYLQLWQKQVVQSSPLRGRMIYVVNQHHQEFPLGLDQFKVNKLMRTQSYFVPSLNMGLMANGEQLFFVERFPTTAQATRAERNALRALQNIATQIHR